MTIEEATKIFNEFGGDAMDPRSGEVHPIARLAKNYIKAIEFVVEFAGDTFDAGDQDDAQKWLMSIDSNADESEWNKGE